jgi:broad specificity phosphatase PhoE
MCGILFFMKEFNENIEHEPKHNIVIVDIMRHGTTEYKEFEMTAEEKSKLEKTPRDLTEQGEKEVKETAEKIINTIDPEKDIVVLWSSPAWRAQGSEEIIKELLEENGIEVYKDSAIKTIRNFDQKDKEYLGQIWEKAAQAGQPTDLVYAKNPEFQEKSDKFESQPEVKVRAEHFFNNIRRIAESIDLKGKRLRIISVSHFEVVNPIMEDVFCYKVEDNQGVRKGENMSFTFDYEKDSKNMEISGDFRGKHIENISFDKNEKHFVVNKE